MARYIFAWEYCVATICAPIQVHVWNWTKTTMLEQWHSQGRAW